MKGLLLVLTLAATVAGCAAQPGIETPVGRRLNVMTLEDGTRCAVVEGGESVAMSCDWDHRGSPPVSR